MYGHGSDTNLSVVAGNLLLYGSFRFGHCFFLKLVHQLFCWQASTQLFRVFDQHGHQVVFVCVVWVNLEMLNILQVPSESSLEVTGVAWGAFSDEVKYFTMIVPQESGQLPLSRLGDAMCEVGNSVQPSLHPFRMEKEPIF